MNIRLPESFVIPLQHIFALYDQSLAKVISIHDAGVLELIMERLLATIGRYESRNGKILGNHSEEWASRYLHNNCLSILYRMIREGTLDGAAMCEVSIIGDGAYHVKILGARKRNWGVNIREQNWETHRNFPIILVT